MNNKNNDMKLLEQFATERNLRNSTKELYKKILTKYCNYHKLTLTELIQEADTEEEDRIRWKHRTIRTRLLTFRTHLIQQGLLEQTITSYMTHIKAIYRHYDIELQPLPPISKKNITPTPPTTFQDLPTPETLATIINTSKPLIRSWICLQSSSGLANVDIFKLTIDDYLEFTYPYHKQDELSEAIIVMNENIEQIIPTIRNTRRKTGVTHYTFCSNEAIYEINNYLTNRVDDVPKLFNISRRYINKLFTDINERLKLGRRGKFYKLTPYSLRKYHASRLKLGEYGLSEDKINSLQGRARTGSDKSYFFDDAEQLRQDYIRALPNLLINWQLNNVTLKSPEYLELENKYNGLVNGLEDRINEMIRQKLNEFD